MKLKVSEFHHQSGSSKVCPSLVKPPYENVTWPSPWFQPCKALPEQRTQISHAQTSELQKPWNNRRVLSYATELCANITNKTTISPRVFNHVFFFFLAHFSVSIHHFLIWVLNIFVLKVSTPLSVINNNQPLHFYVVKAIGLSHLESIFVSHLESPPSSQGYRKSHIHFCLVLLCFFHYI